MDIVRLNSPESNPPLRRCTACGNEFPATSEFFYPSQRGAYGLKSQCKPCVRARKKSLPKPISDMKRCTGPCGRELPATPEFFYREKTGQYGLYSQCKDCKNQKKKAYESRPEVKERHHIRDQEYRSRPEVRAREQAHRQLPEVRERQHAHYRKWSNKPEVRERRSAEHKIYMQTYQETYYSRPEVQERKREWSQEYLRLPEVKARMQVQTHNYRARKRGAGGQYTPEQIQDQLKRQKHRCYYCSVKFERQGSRYLYHIEHVIPLVQGGSNDISNIVLACAHCNISKNGRRPDQWSKGGRLL